MTNWKTDEELTKGKSIMSVDESKKKLLRLSIKIDDLASLVGHQRKRYNHSSTFNALNHDNYSPALNFHQDYNRYTSENNHLKLCKGIHL